MNMVANPEPNKRHLSEDDNYLGGPNNEVESLKDVIKTLPQISQDPFKRLIRSHQNNESGNQRKIREFFQQTKVWKC